MKAIKIELVFKDGEDAKYFIFQLPRLIDEYKNSLLLCHYYDVEYVDK